MIKTEGTVLVGLTAVVVAVKRDEAMILTLGGDTPALPFGAFEPYNHRTLELALRCWVEEQTRLKLGYVEQLYTFGNRHRDSGLLREQKRLITVGYLALVGQAAFQSTTSSYWVNWYEFLPWEDHRRGRPETIDKEILPCLEGWSTQEGDPDEQEARKDRIRMAFGTDRIPWDPEKVLARFELLYEAGLVEESHRDWQDYPEEERDQLPITQKRMGCPELLAMAKKMGRTMDQDHRRILASSLGRLRGKIKYRPVVFELVPEEFTLLNIQKVVEALSGVLLHKQNFRRLLLQGGLVKETPNKDSSNNGRPAALFRFRRGVLFERPAPGVGLPQRGRGV